VNYTIVLIASLTFMMALVSVLDFVFTKFVLWVFGG
jgi:preprotein translocase subunit SecE